MFLFLALDVLIADQVSKWWAIHHLQDPIIFTEFFRFSYHENPGIAFSIPITGLPLLLLTIVLILGGCWAAWSHLPMKQYRYQIPVALILGGALGNGLDRFRLGYVVDFISIGSFPIFNIADMGITVGGALLLWQIHRMDHTK